MFSDDDVMRDLHEVIDFRPFLDPGAAEAGAINRRIGSDFHVVVHLHDADLGDFHVPPFRELETETIAAKDGAAVDDHAISHLAARADGHARSDLAIFAQRRIVADVAMSANQGAGADRTPSSMTVNG